MFQRKHAAPLICLSATLSRSPEDIVEAVNQILERPSTEAPFRVAVGGSGAAAARMLKGRLSHPDRVRFFDSASEFILWGEPFIQPQSLVEHESH